MSATNGFILAAHHLRATELQACINIVQRHRLHAQAVRQANARLISPDIRAHDQAKGLIACALRRAREDQTEIGLSLRISDRIRPLH